MAENLKLDVDRLSRDELLYELAVFGVEHPAEATVDDLRKVLRKSLRLEKSSLAYKKPKYPFLFAEDQAALESKLLELEDLLDNFDGTDVKVGKKITSKFAHGLGRLNRSEPKDDVQKKSKFQMRYQFLLAYDNFVAKTKTHKKIKSSTLLDLSVLNSSMISGGASSGEDSSSDEEIHVSKPQWKPVPVRDWGIKFSGEKSGVSLSCFFERVDELKRSRHVTRQMLFEEAGDLFEGEAKKWFNLVKDWVVDWDTLAEAMREEFQGPDYDKHLFEEIKRRTQGENESIGAFIAAMNGLFSRLKQPVPNDAKLKILVDNIAPFYQPHLAFRDITSVMELLTLCRKLDAKRHLAETYVPPPRRNKCLEPDLACAHASSISSRSRTISENSQSSHPHVFAATGERARNNTFRCWNCNGQGHLSLHCTAPRKLHCFRCGQVDVTVKNCPKCNQQNQGNGNRRQ